MGVSGSTDIKPKATAPAVADPNMRQATVARFLPDAGLPIMIGKYVDMPAGTSVRAVPVETWTDGKDSLQLCMMVFSREKAASLMRSAALSTHNGPDIYQVINTRADCVVANVWQRSYMQAGGGKTCTFTVEVVIGSTAKTMDCRKLTTDSLLQMVCAETRRSWTRDAKVRYELEFLVQ